MSDMTQSRARTSIPVDFEATDVRGTGRIKNLSAQGLFIGTTSRIPDEGELVHLKFAPPGEPSIHVVGLVWWTTQACPDRAQRSPGFGLRLIEDSAAYDRAVDRLLA